MQTYNLNDELKETFTGPIEELTKKIEESDPSDHHVIGTIPSKGDEIKVRGLVYIITSSDKVKGKFIAQIKKP